LLATVANQAAVAVENARLLARETRWARQLAGLQEIGITLTSQLDLEELLGSIVDNANRIMSADFSTLFPYDSERNRFARGIRRGKVDVEPSTPSNTGFAAHIAQTQQALFAEDAEKEPGVKPTFIETKKVKSFAGVPLVFQGRTVGVLFVNYFGLHGFAEEEREAARLLANQAAVAIENARLYETLKQNIDELKHAQDRLLIAERLTLMSRVVAEFAHRLGNVAGTIPVRVALAKEMLDPGDTEDRALLRILDGIDSDAKGLLKAAGGLKRPAVELVLESADLNLLVRVAIAHQGIPSRIRVVENLAPDLPKIAIPREQFMETLNNLITNAVDAMPEKGALTVSTSCVTREGREFVQLDVSDTGVGIPADKLDRIFELFYTTKPGGLGYGLWRDKNQLESLGGKILVKSEVGRGSKFTVLIPVSR